MFVLYVSLVVYLGWRLCAPLRLHIVDGLNGRDCFVAASLCFVPMAWCVGYTAAVTVAWILLQSASLIGWHRPEVAVAAWASLVALLLASLCCGGGRSDTVAPRIGRVPCSWLLLVLSIWALSIALTFGVTRVDAGMISTPQNLLRDLYSHTAIIRSFSFGYNFPTEYPFFQGDVIRYHFLFYFGGGVLEALGAPLSVALNLPSALGFGSLLSLASFIAWRLTDSFVAAALAVVFCLLRSSLSWLDWIAAMRRSVVERNPVFQQSFFYGITPYEDWGIFSLNSHLNQRHLMQGLALMLVVLVSCIFTPRLKAPLWSRSSLTFVTLGILVGCGAYWNGPAFITSMLALIPLVCVADYRVKALCVGISALLSSAIVVTLVTSGALGNTPFQPVLRFGFLSESSEPLHVLRYALWIFGVLPVVSLIGAWRGGVRGVTLWACGLMPIVLMFVAQVTPEAPQGHKFINAGTLVWSVLSAGLVASLLGSARRVLRVAGQLLIVLMTITGVVDAGALVRLSEVRLRYPVDGSTIRWIQDHTPRDAIFLAGGRGDLAPTLAGRRLFIGPESLTSATAYRHMERVSWLREVITLEPSRQILELRDKGITHIATEVCRDVKGLISDPCPALPEVDVLVRNPLMNQLYSSPDITIVGVPRP